MSCKKVHGMAAVLGNQAATDLFKPMQRSVQ